MVLSSGQIPELGEQCMSLCILHAGVKCRVQTIERCDRQGPHSKTTVKSSQSVIEYHIYVNWSIQRHKLA